ncbi:MAG: hypothetical protein F4040_06575 [Synechococcus sp. SB0670_bin_20]|nr:hypothetical protein [Synechococcus sp. SB0670_bin_20]
MGGEAAMDCSGFALLVMLKALWTLFSGFGLAVFLLFVFIGAFITDHWQELLLVLPFLGFLLLGIVVFIFVTTLAQDNAFKESTGDLWIWLQWGIVPERLQSEGLKKKIKELRVKYGTDND